MIGERKMSGLEIDMMKVIGKILEVLSRKSGTKISVPRKIRKNYFTISIKNNFIIDSTSYLIFKVMTFKHSKLIETMLTMRSKINSKNKNGKIRKNSLLKIKINQSKISN